MKGVGGMSCRQTSITLDEDLMMMAKIHCLKSKKTFSKYVEDLIKKDLETKKDIRY